MSSDKLLQHAMKLEEDACRFGFDWPHYQAILQQIIRECQEVSDALQHLESPARIQEEIGDIFHAAISLCRFLGFDAEATLALSLDKFAKRMQTMREIAAKRGVLTLHGLSTEAMLALWEEAKHATYPAI